MAGSLLLFANATGAGAFLLNATPKLNWLVAAALADRDRTPVELPNGDAETALDDVADDSDDFSPGLSSSQHSHFLRCASLRVMQALHSHLALCLATKLAKPLSTAGNDVEPLLLPNDKPADGFAAAAVPGLVVSHATHLTASDLFGTMHVSHSHVPEAAGLNADPVHDAVGCAKAGASGLATVLLLLLPGLAVKHATHFVSASLLRSMQASHSHELADGAN